jgi:hypothetical protein
VVAWNVAHPTEADRARLAKLVQGSVLKSEGGVGALLEELSRLAPGGRPRSN